MDPVSTTRREARGPRRRNRGAIVKLTLAGLALVGIGAAATSAAWTDDAIFTGAVNSASVSLQASLDGTTWKDADSVSGSGGTATHVEIPASTFQNLVPAVAPDTARVIPVTLYIRNNGNAKLSVVGSATGSGSLFGAPAPLTVALTQSTFTLAAGPNGTATSTTLNLTIPANWPSSYKNSTGTNTVTVTFTATATP